MTDMIEKMARALKRVEVVSYFEGWQIDEVPRNQIEEIIDAGWRTKIYEAKAALAVLEDPSEEIIQAGVDAFYNLTGDGRYQPIEKDISTAFNAMIKAAKGEG
jgi:hypothetical protein